MSAAGLWMLALVAIVMIATGLPAFVVLIGVAVPPSHPSPSRGKGKLGAHPPPWGEGAGGG